MTQLVEESKRAGRYVVVRWVSRGADLGVYAGMLWWWGLEILMTAFAVSSVLDFCIDFWGQKLWAFAAQDRRWRTLLKQFGFYIFVRGGNIAAAFGAFYLLTAVYGWPLLKAGLVVIPVFWTIGFFLYHWIFLGTFPSLDESTEQKQNPPT